MKDLSIHPTMGEGKPEELKYELSGFWSRQINKKDRLIYQINDFLNKSPKRKKGKQNSGNLLP